MKISKVQWIPQGLHVTLHSFYSPQQWWMVVFTNSCNKDKRCMWRYWKFKIHWRWMRGGALMDLMGSLTAWECHLNLTLPRVFSRWLHPVGLWQHPGIKLLTQTLIGGVPSGPGPGSVLVKGVTSLAVSSHCVMLAGADQVTKFPLNAFAGVTVTLTSEGNIDR